MVNKDLHNGPLVCGFNVAIKGLILYIDQNSDVAHCISSVYKEKPNSSDRRPANLWNASAAVM